MLKTVEANHSQTLLQYHLPNVIKSVRTQIMSIASQQNARKFYTRLYLQIQMATQRIFDPLYAHHEHHAVTAIATKSSKLAHQPYSFRELPSLLQQLLVELCCRPSIRSGLDSIIHCYDLASFLGVSVDPSSSSTLIFRSAFDTCLAYPFPYQGDYHDEYPEDWTMAKMRDAANRSYRDPDGLVNGCGNELFPENYLEYDFVENIELIPHVDSYSSYNAKTVPDHWVDYMIDLMRDRVIWIGASIRGELIGVARNGFENLNHRCSLQCTTCGCQVSSEWNGPMIVWNWTDSPGVFFTNYLTEFLNLQVQNDYLLGEILEIRHRARGFRSVTIDHTKESANWQAWEDRVLEMDAISSMPVTLLCETETAEVKASIDRMIAEVTFTTLTAYIDGYEPQ